MATATDETELRLDAQSRATAPRQRRRKPRPDRPTLQHRLEYVAVRIVGTALRHLPIDVTSAVLGRVIGSIMPFTARHRRALDHLAFALPELEVAEREAVARRMWRNLGRVSAEAFQIDTLIADTARVTLPADFHTYTARAQGGAIAATAHLGNWEIAGLLARLSQLELAGVYQALHNPYVEAYLKAMRVGAYPAGLYSKGPALGHTLVRLAREGAAIGIVADFRELRGVPVHFFGHEAFATPLPAMLARHTGKPLLVGVIIRTKGVHFKFLMEEVPVPTTDDRDADIAAATQGLHDVFERWIRLYPDQWMWTHRKWARKRTTPLTLREATYPT